MPNSITLKMKPDVYVGNNGKGQDIYQSPLDFMPILEPDSSFAFASGMPNALTIPGSKYWDNKSGTIRADILKGADSLPLKYALPKNYRFPK